MSAKIHTAQPFDELVKRIIQVQMTKTITSSGSKSALHQAVIDGRIHQARLLLTREKNKDVQDTNGWTPLMLTFSLENEKLAKKMMNMFIKQGSDINIQDKMGRNALMLACIFDRLELVDRLLSEGEQEILTQDNDGNTALILAAQKSDPTALEKILEKIMKFRLDVDTRNNLGYTALLLACKEGRYQNAFYLIQKCNACPYLRDHEFNYNAKEWILRQQKSEDSLTQCRLPQLSAPILPSYQQSLNRMLTRTYTKLMSFNDTADEHTRKRYKQKEKTPTVVTHPECSDRYKAELLNELDKAEQLQADARIKLTLYRTGRYPRYKKREVTSAKLRSVGPNYDADKIVPLRYLFKLYSLSYTEPKAETKPTMDTEGSTFNLPVIEPSVM